MKKIYENDSNFSLLSIFYEKRFFDKKIIALVLRNMSQGH